MTARDAGTYEDLDRRLAPLVNQSAKLANVCFGGPARNRLLACATGSVYAIYVLTNGIKLI